MARDALQVASREIAVRHALYENEDPVLLPSLGDSKSSDLHRKCSGTSYDVAAAVCLSGSRVSHKLGGPLEIEKSQRATTPRPSNRPLSPALDNRPGEPECSQDIDAGTVAGTRSAAVEPPVRPVFVGRIVDIVPPCRTLQDISLPVPRELYLNTVARAHRTAQRVVLELVLFTRQLVAGFTEVWPGPGQNPELNQPADSVFFDQTAPLPLLSLCLGRSLVCRGKHVWQDLEHPQRVHSILPLISGWRVISCRFLTTAPAHIHVHSRATATPRSFFLSDISLRHVCCQFPLLHMLSQRSCPYHLSKRNNGADQP